MSNLLQDISIINLSYGKKKVSNLIMSIKDRNLSNGLILNQHSNECKLNNEINHLYNCLIV